ncbi:hypothetical protein BH09BAC3_BH09BAC3_32650 [soil metagenome]
MKIIAAIIAIPIVVGFLWLVYRLIAPSKKEDKE